MGKRVVSEADRFRLGRLIGSDEGRALAEPQILDELMWLLEDCEVVEPEAVHGQLVTMNSTVHLIGVTSEVICTVVYPEDVDIVDNGASVLDALGARLIGRRVGDLISCEDGGYRGIWHVANVVFQPERAGAFHL